MRDSTTDSVEADLKFRKVEWSTLQEELNSLTQEEESALLDQERLKAEEEGWGELNPGENAKVQQLVNMLLMRQGLLDSIQSLTQAMASMDPSADTSSLRCVQM